MVDIFSGFARGEAARASGAKLMVFDWDRAARRIKDSGAVNASAGLAGDWEWTGGEIWRDGKPLSRDDTYTYLASIWAMPELELDGVREGCWVYADTTPGWDSDTFWPASALAIVA